MKTINLNASVYENIKSNPEVLEIMQLLGFEDIIKPGMLNTAGRFMTIAKGAALKRIDMEKIKQAFIDRGYELIE